MYEADSGDTPWTRRCLRQADHVLVVAAAEDDPEPQEVEAGLLLPGRPFAGLPGDLVLVHPGGDRPPSGTDRWLAPRGPIRHHHLCWERAGDMERLGRFLAGRAVGIVLAGGGAKALAHIGVLKALREASIPVDIVGGSSWGALDQAVEIGYLHARERPEHAGLAWLEPDRSGV